MEFSNELISQIFDGLNDEEIQNKLEEIINDSTKETKNITKNDHIYSIEKTELVHKGTDRGIVYILVDNTEHYNYLKDIKNQKDIAEQARMEAEQANASKSRFLSVVSHEIRTPMNAVVGMTELLLRESESLNEKQEKYLENIKTSGEALVMIVNDILDQSKIEAGKMELVEEPYELDKLVSAVMMIIENRVGEKPIEIIQEIDEDVPKLLLGDGLRIRQILINLMNNAVKFTDEGFIKLLVQKIDENEDKLSIKFCIKDSGQGIKEEDLSRLGEAFSQVDTKKNHGKEGTGLGLSISKDFISMMGGQLQVSSVYGEGSEFYFTIEQGKVDAEHMLNDETDNSDDENETFVCPKAKILVVDDTMFNLMIMEEMLEVFKIETDTATSGNEAIEMVKEKHYDLVFMDYMMPNMDGVETTQMIRELAANNDENKDYYNKLPIVALTGDDSEDTKAKFDEAGINGFIVKPVKMDEIKKSFTKWLPKDYLEKE